MIAEDRSLALAGRIGPCRTSPLAVFFAGNLAVSPLDESVIPIDFCLADGHPPPRFGEEGRRSLTTFLTRRGKLGIFTEPAST
jgi:hypothetical protein